MVRILPARVRFLAVVAIGFGVVLGFAGASRAAPASSAPVRLGVMEFGLAGGGAEAQGLGAGLQSMVTTDLANVASLVLVERARLRDVAAELKLGSSKLVDPSTAARLGKVVGASHLVTGSVTIAGAKLRIDARLVEVATGRVLYGDSIDGQADVFFELEKALVRKLVEAIAVEITPKERGAMARVQTADFEAFRKYSLGLKLFDDRKYDEALNALRDASDRDADFSLARTTLAEYERLAASLRREAMRIEDQRAVESERKLNRELTDEQRLLGRMFEVAGRAGDAARDQRLTALYLLAKIYNDRRTKLADEEDRFAWERTTDALFQRYLGESLAVFPRFPALINGFDDQGWWKIKLPEAGSFDADIARLAGELKDYGVRTPHKDDQERARLFHKRRSLELDRKDNAERLHLDVRARADFEDRLDALLARQAPDWLRDHPESTLRRAELRRSILDLDASTRIVVGLRGAKAEPAWLRKLADLTEANARIKALLDASRGSRLVHEMVMLWLARQGQGAERALDRLEEELKGGFAADGTLTDRGARELTEARQLRGDLGISGWVIIGSHVVWNVIGQPFTGPRRDPQRADELRYIKNPAERADRDRYTLLIVDGVPRRELVARFQLDLGAPPADFKPDSEHRRASAPAAVGRPTVTFVFAVRDVDRTTRDAKNRDPQVEPMHALGLRLEAGRAQLVDLTRPPYSRGGGSDPKPLVTKVLAERRLGKAAAGATTFDVSVRVDGKKLRATVAGETFDLPVSNAEPGFYGFVIEDPGYAAIRSLDITSATAH